jgi:hypothetical protein
VPLPGNRISDLLARSLVSIQTTLPRLHFTCSYFRRKYFKYFSCALMLGICKDAVILHDTARGCPGGCDKAVVHTIKKRPVEIGVFMSHLGNVHL